MARSMPYSPNPDMKARLASLGGEPMILTPTELKAFIGDEIQKWSKVVTSSGIKVE